MVVCNAAKETVGIMIHHLSISHFGEVREQRIILRFPIETPRTPEVFLYIKFPKDILALCGELLEVVIGKMASEIIGIALKIDLANNSNVSCPGRDDLAKVF